MQKQRGVYMKIINPIVLNVSPKKKAVLKKLGGMTNNLFELDE